LVYWSELVGNTGFTVIVFQTSRGSFSVLRRKKY
jgi:hypothetical protein